LKRVTVWPSASNASTSAGPRKNVPPRTSMRLGEELAHRVEGSSDEQAAAPTSNVERLRNLRRSTVFLSGDRRSGVRQVTAVLRISEGEKEGDWNGKVGKPSWQLLFALTANIKSFLTAEVAENGRRGRREDPRNAQKTGSSSGDLDKNR
jgi:hypothetical protein